MRTVRLEQNYRSTGTILKAANAVIQNNPDRLGKTLWTEASDGELIDVYAAYNDLDEARYVVNTIEHAVLQGQRRSECAVLYRSNAQSRVLEEALIAAGMPYRVYGGLRFFERAEIKDALAYLRLAENERDDAAFERIVNVPTRGIGAQTVDVIRQQARGSDQSMHQAAQTLIETNGLPGRARNAVAAFLDKMTQLRIAMQEQQLQQQVQEAIELSGLKDHFAKERGEKGQARIENLDELINAAREFAMQFEQADEMTPLAGFLAQAALEAGTAQASEWEDAVQLMTLHRSNSIPSGFTTAEALRLTDSGYITSAEAAKQLGISQATVQKWYKLGVLSGKHDGGQSPLWIEWTEDILYRLSGSAVPEGRMVSSRSLCRSQDKRPYEVLAWAQTEGHTIYRLRRGTAMHFFILPKEVSEKLK